MRLDSLKGKIIVTPAPKTELQWYYNDYDQTYSTYGLDAGTNYSVRILPGMADIYGNTINNGFSFTLKTADMDPYAHLAVPWTPLVYRAKGSQDVFFEHINLDSVTVSLYSLTFDDFSKMANSQGDTNGSVSPTAFVPKTAPIREWNPNTQGPRNQTNQVDLKLEDQAGNPLAPGYYFIGVKGSPLSYTDNFYQASVFIVATDNITLKATSTEGLAWVTDLESGAPQANVPVMFYDKDFNQVGTTTSTNSNGLVYLKGINSPVYARVEGTNHLAFVSTDWGSGVWTGDLGIAENYYGNTNAPFVYLYTDRPIYRPGQDVYFKGLVRQNDDLHYSLLNDAQVYVTIANSSSQQVYAKYLSLSQLGSINDDFTLGNDAALGTYTISVSTSPTADAFGSLNFRVADYQKPQFQVNISSDKADVLNGDKVNFGLDATYYSGGNVGNANVDWFTEAMPYTFTPDPKYSEFNFADWDQDQYYLPPQPAGQGGTLEQGNDTTDANGHLDLSQALNLGETASDQQVTLNANVTDVAGDVVSGQTSVIVHQSELYGGIRSVSYVGKQGQPQQFEAVVLDWDSKPIAGQNVTVKFVERQWLSVQKQDEQGQLSWVTSVKDIPVDQKSVTTDQDGKAEVSFVPPEGGVYKAIVIVTDSKGNQQQASAYTWVSSDQYISWRETNDRTFNLVADKNMYSPGDTAQLLIAQPFQGNVYALVTTERGHIYKQDVVLLTGNSTVYSLPITSDMAPMTYISVVVVKGSDLSTNSTPDFKIGLVRINVDTSQQTLNVSVTTDKQTAGPGDKVTYTITTKDQSGKPVSADVSLAVVDKAVLALAPSNSDPILKDFYPDTGLGVQTALGLVSSADDFNALYRNSIPTGGGAGGGGGNDNSLGIVTVRQDFKDTAFFQAQVTTDANGQAQVTVTLPQNLTTWVADVRAATIDGRVGTSYK